MCHANVDANLMVRNVTQIKSGIMINVGVALEIRKKYIMCAKKIIFAILLHVVVKLVNMRNYY